MLCKLIVLSKALVKYIFLV